MQPKMFIIFVFSLILTSCVSIPKETITLSQTMGGDLQALHQAHEDMMLLYYRKIEDNINTFVDDVYAPFIINYMLKSELERHESGESSLYGVIENGATSEEQDDQIEALQVMREFQEAVFDQINSKKEELLKPLFSQKEELLNQIDQSYENVIYANASITKYLESIGKLKGVQQQSLSMAGLSVFDSQITNRLIAVSEKVNDVVSLGKSINLESETATQDIQSLTDQIKNLTN